MEWKGRICLAWAALGAMAGSVGAASATTLVYTSPCTLMHVWRAWDDVAQDSVTNMDCTAGGDPATETVTVYLWRRPIGPGVYVRADSHRVAPCSEDSFPGQGPGHYYLTARNSAGEACGSGQVTILPGVLTGVEVVGLHASVLIGALYDVHGRRVAVVSAQEWDAIRGRGWLLDAAKYRDLGSGVYWLRGVTRERAVLRRRVVLVR